MRRVVGFCILAITLAFGAPAQAQTASPEQLALADAATRDRLTLALNLCASDSLDIAAMEQAAVAAGWPAFEDAGRDTARWRTSNIRVGEGVLASFGLRVGDFEEAPEATTVLSCKIIMPSRVAILVSQSFERKFGDDQGFYYLENGATRSLTVTELLAAEFPQMLSNVGPAQRLVITSVESRGPATIGEVSVFHRRTEATQ